jgi:hypothetical protein
VIHQLAHPNLIVVHYRPYQGGKFFINCLAHHRAVMPQLDTSMYVPGQDFKIQQIHNSLPPPEHLRKWAKFELGCRSFWGSMLTGLLQRTHHPNTVSIELLSQYCCFVVNHLTNPERLDAIDQALPVARHIVLVDADEFCKMSIEKKAPLDYDLALSNGSFTRHMFKNRDAFFLDVDSAYSDLTQLTTQLHRCLTWLGLDTKLDPALHSFVKQYFSLHQSQQATHLSQFHSRFLSTDVQ